MVRSSLFCFTVFIQLVFLLDPIHSWGYDDSDGPATWQGTCKSGNHQSPVDIRLDFVDRVDDMSELVFTNYGNDGPLNIKNFENSVKIIGFDQWTNKQPYVSGGALHSNYLLQNIHFHWSANNFNGSEHTIDGHHYQVEVHFVHQKNGTTTPSKEDDLAVIAVFLELGSDNSAFSLIDDALKNIVEPDTNTPIPKFQPNQLLPNILSSFYTYSGSLTTPNCDQVVVWTIIHERLSITQEQLNLLRQIKSKRQRPYAFNFRPTQPLNDRHILYRSSNLGNSQLPAILLVLFLALVVIAAIVVFMKYRSKRRQPDHSQEYIRLLTHDDEPPQ